MIADTITKVIYMDSNETENTSYEECEPNIDPMVAIREAEALANEYRGELLDMAAENAQLWHDYDTMYDTVLGVRNRIKAVERWNSDPTTTLGEIKDMLAEVVE